MTIFDFSILLHTDHLSKSWEIHLKPKRSNKITIHVGDPYAAQYTNWNLNPKRGTTNSHTRTADRSGCSCGATVPANPPTEHERIKARGIKAFSTIRFTKWYNDDATLTWEW